MKREFKDYFIDLIDSIDKIEEFMKNITTKLNWASLCAGIIIAFIIV